MIHPLLIGVCMPKPNVPIKAWWGLFKQVAKAWLDDYVPSMGAALA